MPGTGSIDGLVSGLDTSSIVDSIIEYERTPALVRQIDQAEKTNVISTLKALQAKLFAVQSKAQQLTYKATYDKATVSVTDEAYLTATASGRVGAGSYDLQVLSVARNHQIASQGFSAEEVTDFGTGTIEINLGTASPQIITIDDSNNSLTAIKDAINDAHLGVTASILNDGSASNSYRMVLTADKTGLSNTISINSNLSAGPNLNFSTASFDAPEAVVMNSGSDARISLGSSATYTGGVNKSYTFTVLGTGSQVVGSDNVTIGWSDGVNTGSIIVTQADFETELVGEGADGLRLSFSAGELNAGDTFQVQTFAPLLQESSNAQIAFGSTGGSGSPITVVNESNSFHNVIAGVKLDVKEETAPGQFITVTTDIDVSGVKEAIQGFIDAYNDVNTFIDDQNKFNKDTNESGVLLGDQIVQTMQYSLRGILSSTINTESGQFRHMSSIGVRTGQNGKLSIKDNTRFEEAIRENLDDVVALFTDSGYASTNGIELITASTDSKEGEDYAVNITQAATQGTWTGVVISDPAAQALVLDSSNNRLQIIVNGKTSDEIVLAAKSYESTSELINEIQLKIDSDLKIGAAGLQASWVEDEMGSGRIVLTSAAFGKTSKVTVNTSIANSAAVTLRLGAGVAVNGLDVAGTINGEEATGSGQYLTGNSDNKTTAGLKLKITLSGDQVTGDDEGSITIAKGVASKLNVLLTSLTATGDGLLDRRILKRERLMLQFRRMEQVLGQLGAQGDAIASQVAAFNDNWNTIRNNR
jgi:flagellar hook-associated protein 2